MQETPQNPSATPSANASGASRYAEAGADAALDAVVSAAVGAAVSAAADSASQPEAAPVAADTADTAAADLPSMEDLEQVAAEVQRVETALPLLDKKNSPMCEACQEQFASAGIDERMELLQCTHQTSGAS